MKFVLLCNMDLQITSKLTAKQKEILELAKTLFSEKGYAETSMRDLAMELGIKASSIYTHFTSKEEILEQICNVIYEKMKANQRYILESSLNANDKFNEYLRIHLISIIEDNHAYNIYAKYWKLMDEKLSGKYGVLNNEYFDFIKGIVKDMYPNHEDKECYVPNFTTIFIINILGNVPRFINPENKNIDMLVEDIQNRIMCSLAPFKCGNDLSTDIIK